MRRITLYRVVLAALFSVSFVCAYAVDTGRIKGTVPIPPARSFPNVTVTTTTTNASGDYLFQNLAIGTYAIGVSVQGLWCTRRPESFYTSTRIGFSRSGLQSAPR